MPWLNQGLLILNSIDMNTTRLIHFQWFNIILEWKIQFAVIYKGYKFFNRESEPDKKPYQVKKCPAFKIPTTNNLCLKDGMTGHWAYYKQIQVSLRIILIKTKYIIFYSNQD